MRGLVGTTLGREAEAGSIRGDFSMSQQLNTIHASANEEDAARELEIVFGEGEIFDYVNAAEPLIYADYERKKNDEA